MTYDELVNIADRRNPRVGLREGFECDDVTQMAPVVFVILREIRAGHCFGEGDGDQLCLVKEYLRDVASELIVVAETFKEAYDELGVVYNQRRFSEGENVNTSEVP